MSGFFFVAFLPNAKFANYLIKSLITFKKSKFNIKAHFIGRLRINPTNKDARHISSFRTRVNAFIVTTKKSKHKIKEPISLVDLDLIQPIRLLELFLFFTINH